MKKAIIDNCVKAIDRSTKLRPLNMFIKETFGDALSQAHSIEESKPARKLEGSLMTIKDNFSTKSVGTTCGSKMLREYVPPFSATVVDKLVDSGAISLGKTNMDEFGMGSVSSSFIGAVKNPWNLYNGNKQIDELDKNNDWFISGGSSGGSAASVAAGIADFSIGTDTGGSIRNPASLCGVIGYKPTYGLISRFGVVPLNNYFDTVGILTKSMDTLTNVLNQIAGPDPRDATTIKTPFKEVKLDENFNVEKIRIGIPKEFYPTGMAESNLIAWESAVQTLAKKGNATFVEISMPHVPYSMSCYSVLTSCEVASNFARYDGLKYGHRAEATENETLEDLLRKTRDTGFSQIVKGRILSGNYFLLKENYDKYFLKSQKTRNLIENDFKTIFNSNIDIILTPTCFHDTFTYDEYLKQEGVFDEKDFFTACANIAGLPAISLPASLSDKNLPVGVQFIANTQNDDLLLNVANWFSKNHESNFNYLNLQL